MPEDTSEDEQIIEGIGEQEEQESGQGVPLSKNVKSPEDKVLDQWLNQISNDPKEFLKKKFYLESKRNGTKEAIDPW
jgi:hypothetical protein